MKKLIAVFPIIICLVFTSCMADTTGYSSELTSSDWKATLKGGAEVKLSFDEETAMFSMKNGEAESEIKGKYIVDEIMFVIFVPEISQNYGFEYTPKGDTLDLKYGEYTITLDAM